MPLAFKTLSFETIAFGFFNIESDMLLLERYFFFASDFCLSIQELAGKTGAQDISLPFNVYDIEDPTARGDLMGAIDTPALILDLDGGYLVSAARLEIRRQEFQESLGRNKLNALQYGLGGAGWDDTAGYRQGFLEGRCLCDHFHGLPLSK